MHPNAYLRAFWRNETLDQVFVAMAFGPKYLGRFDSIIRPAVEAEPIVGRKLRAYRVDNAKTGDSILTDIIANIAHSRLVLADVSVVDEGRYTERPIRNANVMYEVGVALACRQPSEVLLIRDDTKDFLFDVSSIPHLTMDFSDSAAAVARLRAAIADRISETDVLLDARISIEIRRLTQDEIRLLRLLARDGPDQARDISIPKLVNVSIPDARGLAGLLEKGCIQTAAVDKLGTVFHSVTSFGYLLAAAIDRLWPDSE